MVTPRPADNVSPIVRPEVPGDEAAIDTVQQAAFGGPDEALIVARLRAGEGWVDGLSLVAEVDGRVVGHSIMSRAWLEARGGASAAPILALGPVAVDPKWQRRSVGSVLIRAGIDAARALNEDLIVVLGHPAYYPRFGFSPARAAGVEPPVDWPDPAWMALALTPAGGRLHGRVRYAAAFEPL